MNRAFAYISQQRKRTENQDSYGVFDFPGFTLAIVCDGMGGHVGGAQASTLAVRTVHQVLLDSSGDDFVDLLRSALERANQAIYEAARKNHRLMGMGTTAVAAIVTDAGHVYIAHVGDSRAYLINEGQAVQVTRDHTMVNLFVDAELLTPEDAATHPEAHVLSRSLGVERQVEVELSEPIELADNDVIFLCSDGVHGVVNDFELGGVDWGQPNTGLQHVFKVVGERDGDDNATAVAVLIADAATMPPTPLPEVKDSIRRNSSSHSATIIPEDENVSDTVNLGSYTEDHEPEAPTEQEDPAWAATPPPQRREEVTIDVRGAQSAPNAPEEPARGRGEGSPAPAKKKKKKKKGKSKLPLLAAVGLGVVALSGVVGLIGASFLGGNGEPTETEEPVAQLTIDDPEPQPTPAGPVPGVEPGEPVPEEVPEHYFAAKLPTPPRRLPHRPLRYTSPPPGGAIQFQAVQKARDGNCARSLDLVQEAMGMSPDHAQLYRPAWGCFRDEHQRKLRSVAVADFEGFSELETHFRGWPEVGDKPIEWSAEEKRLPMWFRPARDGIEFRLEAWANSTEQDEMREVLVDIDGEPTVTDEFAADLLIEAQAALALSRAKREPGVEEAWARRVFVVTSALEGRVGKLIKTHRPELVEELEGLLEKATTRQEGGPPIPNQVQVAKKVGAGEQTPPSVRVTQGPVKPSLPEEPDLGGDPAKGNGKIY